MMKYIKILVPILAILFFIQCSVMKPASERKVTKELTEYKLMTGYILCKNYHLNFNKTIIYDIGNLPENDSLLYSFMRNKNIQQIYIQNELELPHDSMKLDNEIQYQFFYIPALGKRRELRFTFSSDKKVQSEKRKGYKQVVLEEEIYYVEY